MILAKRNANPCISWFYMKYDTKDNLLFKTLFKNSDSIMLITDFNSGKILDINQAAVSFYQYSKAELLDMNISQIHAFTESQIQAEQKKAKLEKRNYLNFQHKLKNGHIKCVESYNTRIEMDNKELLYSIIHDISDKKQHHRDLQKRESSIRTMINSTQSLIYLIHINGYIINLNKPAAQLFNKNPKEMLGDNIKFFLSDKDLTRLKAYAEKVIKTQENFNYQREQSGRIYEVTFYPVFEKGNPVDQICIVARDITELKNSAKALAAIETAGAVCHEMNQPLQVILGNLELLKLCSDDDGPNKKFINTMIEHTERLGKITKKLTHITSYQTKQYIKGAIFDIDKSSDV